MQPLIQARTLLIFAVMMHCWLMVSLVCKGAPRAASAELLSCWPLVRPDAQSLSCPAAQPGISLCWTLQDSCWTISWASLGPSFQGKYLVCQCVNLNLTLLLTDLQWHGCKLTPWIYTQHWWFFTQRHTHTCDALEYINRCAYIGLD